MGTLIRLLVTIKQQNNEIIEGINILKSSVSSAVDNNTPGVLPANLPVSLPVANNDEVLELDQFLKAKNNALALVSNKFYLM